jgi:uncharacterized protein (TIGR03492 family)
MKRRILFVSNGVGEDLIAARLIAELQDDSLEIIAYPLVGRGAYPPSVPMLDPRRDLPSGGFSLRPGLRGLAADLRAGLLGHWRRQRRTLVEQRGRVAMAVAVGDTYCLWMATHADPRPAFVATADSVRTGSFGGPARHVMRRHARQIYARDPDTAEALAGEGLPAVALGNVMLDMMDAQGGHFDLPPDAPVVAILPGSRSDAPGNAVLLAQTASAVAAAVPDVRFLLTIAPTVRDDALRKALAGSADAPAGTQTVAVGRATITLTRAFADAVARAAVVLGMAGTAHEQAAGMGRPVVAFPGPGTQFGPQFLAMQRRLLGDALIAARDWRDAAAAVVKLLRDSDERVRRGRAGRERMGPPGGAQRIALALRGMIQNT